MKKIYLIDGNSFIYRMFFALPEFSTKDGKIVNAIFWMAKFFVNTLAKEKPDYLVFIKDAVWPNFREEIYADYKATRDRMPDNLRSQIDDISKMISMLKIDIVEVAGYEADDVLWTLATKFKKDKNNQVFILSGDKDLFSLISENVFVYDTMKKIVFDSEKTVEKFWVKPEMIIDYLAICWDKADNIPWIEWFWPKKAVDLINQIWWVESIYKEVKKIESWEKTASDYDKSVQSCFKWKTFEKLQKSKEDAFLSLKLATIDLNVNLENFDLENFKFEPEKFKNDEVIAYFKEMEFNSLLEEWDFAMKMTTWKDLNLNVKIIWNNQDVVLKTILRFLETDLWIKALIAGIIFLILYFLLTPIFEAGLVKYIDVKYKWWEISKSEAFWQGLYRFLQVFEYNNIFSEFKILSILNW